MGELADDVVAGEICELCLSPLAETHGYPVACVECGGDTPLDPRMYTPTTEAPK